MKQQITRFIHFMHALTTAAAIRMDLGHKAAMGIKDFLPAGAGLNAQLPTCLFDLTPPIRLTEKELPRPLAKKQTTRPARQNDKPDQFYHEAARAASFDFAPGMGRFKPATSVRNSCRATR